MGIIEMTAIYCETTEESHKLLERLQELGYKWRSGDLPLDFGTTFERVVYYISPKSMTISYGAPRSCTCSAIPFSEFEPEVEDENPQELMDFLAGFKR